MDQRYKTIGDASELRTMAEKCRRLADAISDEPMREKLQDLAAEYEEQARLEPGEAGERPLMRW